MIIKEEMKINSFSCLLTWNGTFFYFVDKKEEKDDGKEDKVLFCELNFFFLI